MSLIILQIVLGLGFSGSCLLFVLAWNLGDRITPAFFLGLAVILAAAMYAAAEVR